ncbi:autism susceptibility gene 2 protein homolog isoform X3 [Schistocerca gregaria]|uniref:autism susceptibility gene 2 protein homolog isoform X3 n=1 Tax=Schistocerca gregaria TaxID=7010 RepID=UPI00211F38C9|nr:autism susceptibility gene 2 protein homolog isoform X3 [Schistocerca gregaria]
MNSPPFTWPYSVPGMPGPPVATPPPPEAFPQPQPLPQMDGQLSSPPDVNLDSPQSIMADGSDLPLHDVTTLRFFYNLGVNVFNTVRKATQSPVLAMHDHSSSQADGSPFSAELAGRGVLQVDAPAWQPQPRKTEPSAHAHGLAPPQALPSGGYLLPLPLSAWTAPGMASGGREGECGQAMRGSMLPCMPVQLVCSPDGMPCALPVVYMPPQPRGH